MTVFSWLWIAWLAAFVGIEGVALVMKDRPATVAGGPKWRTLTANVRWVINTAGPWHHAARLGLIALLAWLPFHFQLPLTDWPSVWPNIVASALCVLPSLIVHHRKTKQTHAADMAQLRTDVAAQLDAHHARVVDSLRAGATTPTDAAPATSGEVTS